MATPITRRQQVPAPPAYPPNNSPARRAPRPARNTKVEIGKINLIPDIPSLPPLSFDLSKTTVINGSTQTPAQGIPGSDFMSNDDIRAFSEYLRRTHRQRAVERALDAEALEAILRTIPDATGSMSGARARARRATRPLRRIAAAEKLIAKSAALLWSTFAREYEAELERISRGRPKEPKRIPKPFQWR